MSSTASNYGLWRLQLGISVAALATLIMLVPAYKSLIAGRAVGLWMSFITILYGLMMFASSYVEEEHHFWYWATSGWLAWLILKQ